MKFNNLYSSILGAALLFGAYGCTDEVSYTPAEKFEGDNVYFETASSSVSLPENATEFEVEIQRYGSTGDLTVNLKNSVVDNEGSSLTDVFTVPSSVTFTGNEATAKIKVAVNFANIVADTPYEVNIAIDSDNVTPYGATSHAVSVIYSPWTAFKRYGGNDDYSVVSFSMVGEEYSVATYYAESMIRPEAKYIFGDAGRSDLNENNEAWTSVNPGNAAGTYINYEVTVDKNTNYVTLAPTYIETFNVNGIGVVPSQITDAYTYYQINPAFFGDMTAEQVKSLSTFNPETGVFEIFTIVYIAQGALNNGYDYIQLPGFAHYEVEFKVAGNFVDASGTESIILSVFKSDDLYSYAYEIYPGDLSEAEIAEKVTELQNDSEAVLYTQTTQTLNLQLPEYGLYTIVVVGYDQGGNKVYDSSFSFEYKTVQSASEWTPIGTCLYTDDYIASMYKDLGGETWEVEVEENINTPGYYRLVNPYYSWLESMSAASIYMPGDYYLYVNASDPDGVYIPESPLGFALDEDGMVIAYSYAAEFLAQGNSLEAIKQAGYCGTMDNGIITFPTKTLLVGFENNSSWYYANVNGTFEIDMSELMQAAPRKANAKGNINGNLTSVKTKAIERVKPKVLVKSERIDFMNGKFYHAK